MPEHAAAAVPASTGGLDCGGHRLSDREILMIAGKDLVAGHTLVAETDEVLQNVQKACLLKHALEEGIELGMGFVFVSAVLGFPLHKPVFAGCDGARLADSHVAHNTDGVVGKQGRNLVHIVPKLEIGLAGIGLFP